MITLCSRFLISYRVYISHLYNFALFILISLVYINFIKSVRCLCFFLQILTFSRIVSLVPWSWYFRLGLELIPRGPTTLKVSSEMWQFGISVLVVPTWDRPCEISPVSSCPCNWLPYILSAQVSKYIQLFNHIWSPLPCRVEGETHSLKLFLTPFPLLETKS